MMILVLTIVRKRREEKEKDREPINDHKNEQKITKLKLKNYAKRRNVFLLFSKKKKNNALHNL